MLMLVGMFALIIISGIFFFKSESQDNETIEGFLKFLGGVCLVGALAIMFFSFSKDDDDDDDNNYDSYVQQQDEEWIRTHHLDGSPRNPETDWW